MELSNIERLAVAQAFYNVAGRICDTKNPDSLRCEMDRFYKGQHEITGAKSFDVNINGVQVGTYSCKFSKEKPQEVHKQLEIRDYVQLAKWFDTVPEEEVRHYVATDLQKFAEHWLAETGEMPDGCGFIEIVKLAEPKHYIGGVLKVDPKKVIDALGDRLPSGIVGLLGDGK